ncbi:MAG: hypothetical protein JWR34_7432 [Mycobacterium sp.]|nr:hypothetical protein [Mycobacterium sp.]
MAARRRQWRESPQFKRYKRLLVVSCVIPVAIGIAIGLAWRPDPTFIKTPTKFLILIFFSCLLYFALYSYVWVFYRVRVEAEFRDDLQLGITKSDLRAADEAAVGVDDQINFPNLRLATQKRLDYYHDIATKQARDSFRNAQLAAAIGFFILIVAGTIAGFAQSASASIAAGATGVVGAALGGYLGSTFVKMQQESSTRLRAYFLQPLEVSRGLAAERLADLLQGNAKNSAILKIIGAVVSPADLSVDPKAPETTELSDPKAPPGKG